MPNLSWNEVRDRAHKFACEWAGTLSERAEKQTFWNEFFQVFGIQRRSVATFEEPVLNIKGTYDFIDLFWPGVVLVEHKSTGQDLGRAQSQAFRYIRDLVGEGRDTEIPRYVIISDFARFALHDLDPEVQRELPLFDQWRVQTTSFPLSELSQHVREFAFLKGEKPVRLDPEDPANETAYKIMATLHDALEQGGFAGHDLERFLVRVLFCLFAEDTGIFEPVAFQNFLERRTREDGSDLGTQLNHLFEVLNTQEDKRQKTLDEDLAAFPYVNGALFQDRLGFPDFNREMRNTLIACCRFQWARISPAVFGSLFQGIMDDKERRQQGAHYTSERDIMKVVRSLFLDNLNAEFASLKTDRSTRRRARLNEFHEKLRSLNFLDPACGCGNFLVLAYRELRRLELALLRELHGTQQFTEVGNAIKVDVDQFYGIELYEWPVRIAEAALWLMDHIMNREVADAFGQTFRRLPLRAAPRIRQDNSLKLNWNTLLPKEKCSFVLGNPPFVGAKFQTDEQRSDLCFVAGGIKHIGLLDYVTGWYFKAAEYIQGSRIIVGFVSTSSIIQGEQVDVLWTHLFHRYGVKIHFGHSTFAWESEARGKAHVHVVIIGFAVFDSPQKQIFDYESDGGKVTVFKAKNISPYLVEGEDLTIGNREKPICDVPDMGIGNKPIDGGYLLFTPEEQAEFLRIEPRAKQYFKRWIGSEEFINGIERWFLWLGDARPEDIKKMPEALKRLEQVAQYRRGEIPAKDKEDTDKNKKRNKQTQKLAETPTRLHVENMPTTTYLVVPEVSSERRKYIPIGFLTPDVLCSNLVKISAKANLFHFGVLSSAMHMAWVRHVCGRLESRYRYSIKLVYNNFPWPHDLDEKHKRAVETAGQKVLDVRARFLPPTGNSTLGDLYDPLIMPTDLAKAHWELDRAVDLCYRSDKFNSDRERVQHLFALYERLISPVLPGTRRRRGASGR